MAIEQFYMVIPIPVIADLIAEIEAAFDTKDFPVIDAFHLRPEEYIHYRSIDLWPKWNQNSLLQIMEIAKLIYVKNREMRLVLF